MLIINQMIVGVANIAVLYVIVLPPHFFSMDKDNTMQVDWNEWRDFYLLNPASSVQEILQYWKHTTVRLAPRQHSFRLMLHRCLV